MDNQLIENSERYIRKDTKGGYLYNRSEIDYYKQMQNVDIIDNLMFGNYNRGGVYCLDQALIDQLVAVAKVYQYSFGQSMFCQTATEIENFGKIEFAIKLISDAPKKGYSTAVLELLEPVDRANGYYTNTNTVQIETYSAIDTSSFIENALKKFNVYSKKDEGLAKKIKTQDLELIVSRKKYVQALKTIIAPVIDKEYKIALDKKIKALSKSTCGKAIIEKFDKESYKINGWFVKEGTPGYYKYLIQMLDGIIENHSEDVLSDVKLKATLNKLNEETANVINLIINKAENNLINSPELGSNVELYEMYRAEFEKEKQNKVKEKVEVKFESKKKEDLVKEDAKDSKKEKEPEKVKPQEKSPETNDKQQKQTAPKAEKQNKKVKETKDPVKENNAENLDKNKSKQLKEKKEDKKSNVADDLVLNKINSVAKQTEQKKKDIVEELEGTL